MFLLCAITVLTQAPSKRALTVDDLFAIKQVGTPQVSPDGRWVAYTVRSTILKADRNETGLWMAPLDSSGAAIPLTAPGYAPSATFIRLPARRKSIWPPPSPNRPRLTSASFSTSAEIGAPIVTSLICTFTTRPINPFSKPTTSSFTSMSDA